MCGYRLTFAAYRRDQYIYQNRNGQPRLRSYLRQKIKPSYREKETQAYENKRTINLKPLSLYLRKGEF